MLEDYEHPNLQSNEYCSEDDVASVGSTAGNDEDQPATQSSNKKKKKKKKERKKPRAVLEMELFLNEQFVEEIATATSYNILSGLFCRREKR